MMNEEEPTPQLSSEPESATLQQPKPAKRPLKWKRWVVGGVALCAVGGVAILPLAYPLKQAVKDKNYLYAKVLIELGADVNRKSASGKSMLKEALDAHEMRTVQFLLEQPGIDTSAWTPLTLAVQCGEQEMVKQLLQDGQDVNEADTFGNTPLYYAVEHEYEAIADALLHAPKLDLCSKASHGLKLLKMCDDAELRFKISSAARRQLNRIKNDESKSYAEAKQSHDARLVSLYIMADSYYTRDFSPLVSAVLANDIEVVQKFLSEQESYLTDGTGVSVLNPALEWAAFAGHKECMEALIEAGASIDANTSSGRKLFLAAMETGDAETVKLVLMHSSHIDKVAEDALNLLARRGDVSNLKQFIEAGISPVTDSDGESMPLNNAEQCGHVACVELLMQHGARPQIKDYSGNNVFHRAVNGRFPELVRFYATPYAEHINQKNDSGLTPLLLAVKNDNAEVLQALLAVPGIDLNKADTDGYTALALAEKSADSACADLLRQAGASAEISATEARDILSKKGYHAENYLNFFQINSYSGALDESVLRLMEKAGYNLNASDSAGKTPLTYTIHEARSGDGVTVRRIRQLLAMASVDINAADANGDTPLTLSVRSGDTALVEALLAADKVDKNKPNKEKKTALMLAALADQTEIVKVLHQAGADINATDADGNTVLMLCVQQNMPDMVKMLLSLGGAEIEQQAKQNAVEHAVDADNADMVKVLLTAENTNVNATAEHQRTWLHRAAAAGKVQAIKSLLSIPGVDVNLADADGCTALHLAAENGHTATVEALLSVPDIAVNTTDAEGRTAIDAASANKHHNCVQLLINFADSVPADAADKFDDYLKSAQSGNMRSQYIVGLCYLKGSGAERNAETAVEWFRKAAEQGNVNAQYVLAQTLYRGENITPQPAEAYKWYRRVADAGRADAQYMVAEMLSEGEHVAKNVKEAFAYYKKAAEQEHTDAMYSLGLCYAEGIGTKKNPKEAFNCYKKAAEQHHADACFELGYCYDKAIGTEPDADAAFQWYRKAAEQNIGLAQFYLALCYEHGNGADKDVYEAMRWYERAAQNKIPEAIYNLGCCYYHGNGTFIDYDKAYELFKSLEDSYMEEAWFNLGCCYYHGRGTSVDYEKAVKWYRKAADKGYMEAMYNLGCCYYYGHGVKKDKKQSNKWFRKAAEKGHPEAAKFIGH
ncbi:MAG: hypothetical protein E7033_01605 [Akkermansiaceae bacterium]|nr:hypothetical protein [Akkermansiaceae bacterium]